MILKEEYVQVSFGKIFSVLEWKCESQKNYCRLVQLVGTRTVVQRQSHAKGTHLMMENAEDIPSWDAT